MNRRDALKAAAAGIAAACGTEVTSQTSDQVSLCKYETRTLVVTNSRGEPMSIDVTDIRYIDAHKFYATMIEKGRIDISDIRRMERLA